MLPQIGPTVLLDCCARTAPRQRPDAPPPFGRRRFWEFAAGGLSLGVWALVPKCPVCLAAWLALWTGLGLSFTAAAYVRWSLLLLSGVLLVYFVISLAIRAIRALWSQSIRRLPSGASHQKAGTPW
jgi:hypothetical protein